MQGEHKAAARVRAAARGPSLRARGASSRSRSGRRAGRDHPGVRGEHGPPHPLAEPRTGPSPRARGARRHLELAVATLGTIPACAGSTRGGQVTSAARGDHPRVRGEHVTAPPSDQRAQGPSRRARGAPAVGLGGLRLPGTIPACAGSTGVRSGRSPPGWDHPRVRGEHRRTGVRLVSIRGPSPRARGALRGVSTTLEGPRDHPRVRGEHSTSQRFAVEGTDHPRVRGEHGETDSMVATTKGPSPRARGAPGIGPPP